MSDPTEGNVEEELSRARSEAKIKEAREALLNEAAAHQATMAVEHKKAASQLDELLSLLGEEEQRAVRMHAYITYMNADWAEANSRQAGVDLIALRLATYMVTGEAK